MPETLYTRLGGGERVQRIIDALVDNHLKNPRVAKRFAAGDPENLKKVAGAFFVAGSGGPNAYKGKDMVSAHKGMNISSDEFMAVLDDAMAALETNKVGQREKEEVLFILFSMRGDVIRQ